MNAAIGDDQLAADMFELLTSERYSDVVLVAKDGETRFRGHKAVLTARCSCLRSLIEAADEAAGDGGAEVRPQLVALCCRPAAHRVPATLLAGDRTGGLDRRVLHDVEVSRFLAAEPFAFVPRRYSALFARFPLHGFRGA